MTIEATKTEVFASEDITITVATADDNDVMEAIQLFDGYGFRDEEELDGNKSFDEILSFDETGSSLFSLRVLLEGSDEWIMTEPITIKVSSNGPVGNFEITKVNNKTSDFDCTVTRGDVVTVVCSESAHANEYWLDAEKYTDDSDNPWDYYDSFADTDQGTTLSLNTIAFDPGTYRIQARAKGLGYEGKDSENSFILTVEPLDVPEGKVYLDVSKSELQTIERFTYAAYCPDADEVRGIL